MNGRKRGRNLSDDDRAIWRQVAATVKPLEPGKKASNQAEDTLRSSTARTTGREPSPPKPRPLDISAQHRPSVRQPPPPAAMDPRERRRLVRGRKQIDARLDLHGMTQYRAHNALRRFLQDCQSKGHRIVIVVTGKGKRSNGYDQTGILRRAVPEWLRQPDLRPLVVAFEEADRVHGGAGALYVRLRRPERAK